MSNRLRLLKHRLAYTFISIVFAQLAQIPVKQLFLILSLGLYYLINHVMTILMALFRAWYDSARHGSNRLMEPKNTVGLPYLAKFLGMKGSRMVYFIMFRSLKTKLGTANTQLLEWVSV